MSLSSDWKLEHQVVDVAVDLLKQSIKGFTELTVAPSGNSPSILGLNARQMVVENVFVNNVQATFQLLAYQDTLVPDSQEALRDLGTLAAYRTKAWAVSQSRGELQISLPQGTTYPAQVRVSFQLLKPTGGAWFCWPKGEEAEPHMYTAGAYGEASSWFPCFNNPKARCVMDISVTANKGLTIVASGVPDSFPQEIDGDRMRRSFCTGDQCAAHQVFVAVGDFYALTNPKFPSLTHYCMPDKKVLLEDTVAQFGEMFTFFESSVSSPCPVRTFSTLFVRDTASPACSYYGGAVFSDSLLYSNKCVEEPAKTTFELAIALASQWINQFVRVNDWSELWIQLGLSRLLAMDYMRTYEYENNALWRLLELTDEYLNMPLDEVARPLRLNEPGHAWDMCLPMVGNKSLLILAMIQRRVGEGSFQEVTKALFASPAVYETRSFLEKIANTARHTMDDIETFWVQRGGFPTLTCGFSWNQSRHYLEFALKQDFTHARFYGLLPVLVQEMDGVFNHEIMFTDDKVYAWDDFPIHARPAAKKKKKRTTKADKEAAAAAGEEGAAVAPVVAAIEAAEVVVEEKEASPILFLRLDPERQWIMKASFHQPEEMWMNQLDAERHVASEREAVHALRLFRSQSAVERLGDVLNDPDRYVMVRCVAARSLGVLAGPDTDWAALRLLVGYYRETHFKGTVLMTNDFEDFGKYYLARAVIDALADIQQDDGFSAPAAVELILDVLKHNDNAKNRYSDHLFVRTLLLAAGRMQASSPALQQGLAQQLARYRQLGDTLPNSPGATLQEAVFEARLARVVRGGGEAAELQSIRKAVLHIGLPVNVRAAAATCLLVAAFAAETDVTGLDAMQRVLALVESADESPALRRALLEAGARAVRQRNRSLALLNKERLFCEPRHKELLDRVWALCVGPPLAHSEVLRASAWSLYQAIWGLQWPASVLGPAPYGLLLAAKAAPVEPPALAPQRRNKNEWGWRGAFAEQAAPTPSPAPVRTLAPTPTPTPTPVAPAPVVAATPPEVPQSTSLKIKFTLPPKPVAEADAGGDATAAVEPEVKKIKTEPTD